ncbi:MAG: HEWD family protein [Halobacteriaceae archaeon]
MAAVCAPERRTCQRCGREERYDRTEGGWHTAEDRVGSVYCVHVWDITGAFAP